MPHGENAAQCQALSDFLALRNPDGTAPSEGCPDEPAWPQLRQGRGSSVGGRARCQCPRDTNRFKEMEEDGKIVFKGTPLEENTV